MPWTDREWGDRHAFLRDLPDELKGRLPEEFLGFTYRPRGSIAQVFYADPRVHYELWFHWRTGRIEIGLHFERDERTNDALFDWFDRQIVSIKAGLGETIDLERWDKGWARIYETWPCERVDRAFRAHTTARLAKIITVLEPIHQEFGLESEPILGTAAGLRR